MRHYISLLFVDSNLNFAEKMQIFFIYVCVYTALCFSPNVYFGYNLGTGSEIFFFLNPLTFYLEVSFITLQRKSIVSTRSKNISVYLSNS